MEGGLCCGFLCRSPKAGLGAPGEWVWGLVRLGSVAVVGMSRRWPRPCSLGGHRAASLGLPLAKGLGT